NAVEAGLPIHIEAVVRDKIERAKCFGSLRRAFLKALVEHLFPTGRVEAGGVRYHTVEVEKHGVVLVARDHAPAVGLLHQTLSCYQRTSLFFNSLIAYSRSPCSGRCEARSRSSQPCSLVSSP